MPPTPGDRDRRRRQPLPSAPSALPTSATAAPAVYRFQAGDYAQPTVARIPGGSAGKYCMNLDAARSRLYYFTWGRSLFVLSLDGAVLERQELTVDGANAVPQLPLSFLDPSACCTSPGPRKSTGSIYTGTSTTWPPTTGRRAGGAWMAHRCRYRCRSTTSGPSDRITLDDEFEVHSWLSNLLVKDGKAHFAYAAQAATWRQHYVRYDLATAARDIDLNPIFEGEEIRLASLDGFFASRADLPEAPLYYVSSAGGRLGCLASDDNGETWYDYALSEESFNPYSIGGSRELTADGRDRRHLHRLPGGRGPRPLPSPLLPHPGRPVAGSGSRSRRVLTAASPLRFHEVRGRPEAVRFRAASGQWGKWQPFAEVMEADPGELPTHFQLRSHLGVESSIFAVEFATAIGEIAAVPAEFDLAQNAPNPFNARTTIGFNLPESAACHLSIFDLRGRRVRDLLAQASLPPGRHQVAWNGTNDAGSKVASGVYFYRLRAGSESRTRRLVLAK